MAPAARRRSLHGRVALVTGASSGIGEAASRSLAMRGCRVVVCARRLDRLQALADEIGAAGDGGEAFPLRLDVTQPGQAETVVRQSIERYGSLDIVVNNAGVGRMNWFENLDPRRDIDSQLGVNLLGAIHVTRAVLPGMMVRRRGHIINMGSLAAFIGSPQYSIYAASKFGLRGFSEALRREVAPWGIHVSVVYPGGVRTEFGRGEAGEARRKGRTPGWLVLTPETVGEAVARLAVQPRRSRVLPAAMLPMVWANALFPGLIDQLAAAFLVRRQRRAQLRPDD